MCALEEKLTELKKLYQKENLSEQEFYQLAHPLAEEHYEPIREFLIELLDSPNDGIRLQTVHLLNTHWNKQDIGGKFIELLLRKLLIHSFFHFQTSGCGSFRNRKVKSAAFLHMTIRVDTATHKIDKHL